MREKIKKSDNLHRYENPEDTRDWDLNFLIATLGEFDSRGIDGRLGRRLSRWANQSFIKFRFRSYGYDLQNYWVL